MLLTCDLAGNGRMLFKARMFDVFHDGNWYGRPPPTFYLVMPAQRDCYDIACWKIRELGLPPSAIDRLGHGIPYITD
jgi:hypothetical protein